MIISYSVFYDTIEIKFKESISVVKHCLLISCVLSDAVESDGAVEDDSCGEFGSNGENDAEKTNDEIDKTSELRFVGVLSVEVEFEWDAE